METTSNQIEKLEYPKYKYRCGCIGPYPGRKNSQLCTCAKHNKSVYRKIFKCQECGAEFETSLRAYKAKYCPECKTKVKSQQQKIIYATSMGRQPAVKIPKNKHIQAMKERGDCSHRDECMRHMDMHLMYLPCYECSKYAPGPTLDIATLIQGRDNEYLPNGGGGLI